jgi:hypothetical protein
MYTNVSCALDIFLLIGNISSAHINIFNLGFLSLIQSCALDILSETSGKVETKKDKLSLN